MIVDANVILRYLLNDHKEHSKKAKAIIEKNRFKLTNEIIAEVVYVLEKVYEIKRKIICESLLNVIESCDVEMEYELIKTALKLFAYRKLDFVDCLLYSYYKVNNEIVVTFDKKLLKMFDH